MMSSRQHMTSADVARLPLKQIEAALRRTTETLATELAAPTDTTPDWTDFEWCIARAAAAIHGVSPLLAGTLRWRGPASWERFLAEQRDHTFRRHQRIARLLADIGAQAARNGIAIVALKGAALHEIGIYQPGERPMSDLDLLVRSSDVQATARLLCSCGYRESYATWKHRVFEPDATPTPIGFGEHADNPIKIELHARVAERMPVMDRDISALVLPACPQAGLNAYPSITALMIHLLLHAAGSMCFNGLRLIHLHDIALLARCMSRSDWECVLSAADGQASSWVSPALTLTAHYYATAIPAHVVARAASDCSWLLRRLFRRRTLSDVSLSNLWIQALPGVEWSHSLQEALTYIKTRMRPDRQTLALRAELIKRHPSAENFSWHHLSHRQRIVQWVRYRPPRMETLSSVHAALSQADTHPQLTQPS